MDRREFLRVTGAAAATIVAGARELQSAPERQPFKVGMAATLWLQADAATETYWRACEAISKLGFKGTEADNTLADLDTAFGADVEGFKRKSQQCGVSLVGVYQSVQLHETGELPAARTKIANVSKFLKEAGAGYIAMGWGQRLRTGRRVYFTPGASPERTAEDVKNAVNGLNELGRISQEHGIKVAFHPGRNQTRDIIRRVMDESDPKHVFFCADVGHLAGAGYDPVEAVKTYGSRIAASHWKDFDPNIPFRRADYAETIKGDFVELGQGVVDFPALVKLFKEMNYTGWVQLELDRTLKDPIDSATEMKAFVTDTLKLSI
jgi:inosose dehydratase